MLWIAGWPAVAASCVLLLSWPVDCVGADAPRTTVKVTDPQLRPSRGAKVLIYSKDDELIAEGVTDGAGLFVCPEISVDHESVIVVATRGFQHGNGMMMRTEKREWPPAFNVKMRERRIQPSEEETGATMSKVQAIPFGETRQVVRTYYERRLQLHRDAYGRYFYIPVVVEVEVPSQAYFLRSLVIHSEQCSCLP